MRDFLTRLAKVLEIVDTKDLKEEQLEEVILNRLKNRMFLERSLFQLSEDFACSCELSLKVISSINRIIDRIYVEEDIYKFISYCFDEFIKILPAENISFLEKHARWNSLILKVASGKIKLKDFEKKIFRIKGSFAGEAFKQNTFLYTLDAEKDERFNSTLSKLKIRTILSVPVKVKEETVGVINFSHPEKNAFDESTIFFLVSFVKLFSAVLSLFKFYRENLRFCEKLESEINKQTKQLKKINKKLHMASITDALTGINNRRFFFQRFEEEFSKALRYGNTFCLILFDLDNLKKINDTYGHLEGDRIIKLFAKILKSNKRKEDIISRIGGDEFACIIFGANIDGALKFANRIRAEFQNSYKKDFISVSGAVGCIQRGSTFKFYKNYR